MKTVLITGGTRGIGKAVAEAFADKGYAVGIVYEKNDAAASGLLTEFAAKGVFAVAEKADVSDAGQCRRAYSAIRGALGAISVLVNNAGIAKIAPLPDLSDDEVSRILDVDLKGAVNMTKCAYSDLADTKGLLLNISSVWGVRGASCESVYSAAKGGLIAFTKAMAKELAPYGARANCIAPGVVETEMNSCLSKEELSEVVSSIPLGRCASPAEIASLSVFLAGDGASYITGQCIGADGGFGL